MTVYIALAFLGGLLISLSRQLNGRLALSTTPLVASFWNHVVGFVAITVVGLAIGGLIPAGAADAPWHDYVGGPLGVVFVAAGSWLIGRIGAASTALLVIGGQMVSGVAVDLWQGAPGSLWVRIAGVALIMTGMVLLHGGRKPTDPDEPAA